MQKIILVTGFLMAFTSFVNAQCPTAGFSAPDSVCAGATFQVTNTSVSGVEQVWNFCPGKLKTAPVTSLLSNFAGLNFPQQLRLVTDNGNHYIFVANLLGTNLLRYDFGTDINSVPTVFDYGSVGGLLSAQPAGLDVINDNGNWYALVSTVNNQSIVRIDLGTNIANNTAIGTNLGTFNLNIPRGIKIAKDGADYYAFISNASNNDLTKISFGSSIANTPSGFSSLTDPQFNVPWGFDVAYDCDAGSWVGFYASNALGKIHVIDFGSTLANPGTIVSSITSIDNPSGVSLVHEGDSWFLLTNGFFLTSFQRIRFDGNLLSTPTDITTIPVPQNTSPRNITYLNDSTGFHLFIANNQPNTINKLQFNAPCSATPLTSGSNTTVDVSSTLLNEYQQISMQVTGANGITAYFTDSVFIKEAPLPDFVYSAACEGQSVSFTDSSTLNPNLTTTFTWDFGDATPVSNDQNPVHLFPGSGTFNVTLTTSYSTGCSNSFSQSVFVSPLPVADISFTDNQCSFVPIQFTDISQTFAGTILTEWVWNFGDGSINDSTQNPVHAFDSAGTFTVSLQVMTDAGCIDSTSATITILPAPDAGFTVENTCIGETVIFTNTTAIQGGIQVDSDWDFGDNTFSTLTDPTHQYAATGADFNVILITNAINGCSDTIIQSIHIGNQPVADFSWAPQVVCVGNTVNFTSLSTGTGGDTISIYMWDFGDGNSSTDMNPMYAYGDTGYYDVTLTVISPTYCDSSITQQVYVIPSPEASFTVAGVCLGLTTTFNPLTTTPPNTQIDSIVWSFGDSTGFTGLTSPTHTYSTPGRFEVIMTVYNNLLCTDVFIDSVDVYPLPLADFNYSILCSDSVATFNGNLSSVAGDSITSWLWNFDALGTASGDTADFTFQNAGNYNVTLIVTTSNGCSDTTTQSVSVIESPEFDFTFNEPCFGLVSIFTYVPIGTPVPALLNWNFGDGTGSGLLSPAHIYSSVDTFDVSLRVQHNATGCATTITKPLIVKPYPVTGFAFTNNCESISIQFTDTSSIQTGTIATWNWDFGSLGTSTDQNPVVTSALPGSYPVSMTATSAEGCASIATATLTVFANPEAAFNPDPLYGSPPLLVTYINSSTGGSTYMWDFGDGNSGTGITPSHTYQDIGIYQVTLVATSTEGCIDSAQGIVNILIPFMDIAVTKVFATQDGDLLGLSAEIMNMGNIPVSTFDLSGIIDNGSVITESWSGILQPGVSILYEFTARYDINARTLPGYFCVEATNPNNGVDANQLNNNKCGVIGNSFELYSAYPNPFIDEMSVSFNLPLEGTFNIQVFDAIGKLVFEQMETEGLKGYNKIRLFTPNLNKGIYFIKVEYRDNVESVGVLKY